MTEVRSLKLFEFFIEFKADGTKIEKVLDYMLPEKTEEILTILLLVLP